MEIRLKNCHESLGSGLVRTLSQHVGIALHSVQLTYFKNRSVKSISKFPLWTHLEIKIFCSHSGGKLQNEAILLYFTCFISSRRSQLLPENNIFISTYYLPLYFSWRSNSILTTENSAEDPTIYFETLKAFWFYFTLYFTYINSNFIGNSIILWFYIGLKMKYC